MAINSENAVDFLCGISDPVVKDLLLLVHDTWVQGSIMTSDRRSFDFDQLFAYEVLYDVFTNKEELQNTLENNSQPHVTAINRPEINNEDKAIQTIMAEKNIAVQNLLKLVHRVLARRLSGGGPVARLDLYYFFQLLREAFSRKHELASAVEGKLESGLWDWLRR